MTDDVIDDIFVQLLVAMRMADAPVSVKQLTEALIERRDLPKEDERLRHALHTFVHIRLCQMCAKGAVHLIEQDGQFWVLDPNLSEAVFG